MAFDAGAIEATLDLDRTPFSRKLASARRDARVFERQKFTAKLGVDIDKSGMARALASIGGNQPGAIHVPVDVDAHAITRALRNVETNTGKTAFRVGNRLARALMSPMGIMLASFPAMMATGVAAAGVSLAALPLLMGAVAGAVLAKNEEIAGSFKNLWDTVRNDAEVIVEPLIPWAHKVSDELSKSWERLGPDFADIARDVGPQVLDLTQGITGGFEAMVGGISDAVQVGGPAVRGFESLLRKVGVGAGDFFRNVSEESLATGEGLRILGDIIQSSLGFGGSLFAQMASQWATSGPQIRDTIQQIFDMVLQFANMALPALGGGLDIILSALQTVMFFLEPLAGILGGVTGYLIAAAAGAKLFGGAMTLLGRGWNNLKPGTWVARMGDVGAAVSNVGDRAGRAVGGLDANEKASTRLGRAGARMGTALQNAGGAIPFLGLALIGVGLIQEQATQKANTLADALLRGGQAAADASQQIARMEAHQKRFAASIPVVGGGIAEALFGSAAEAKQIYQAHKDGMTDLERAQLRAAQAQKEYEEALRNHGPASQQAATASINLSIATDNVEQAQIDAANATKSHTDRIIEQTNLMLGAIGARLNYDSSLLQLEESQRALNDALAQHGKDSSEAKNADIAYQQNLLGVINAIGQRVAAEHAALGEAKATELAAFAMRMEIARLAVEAGTNLPPALAEMAAALSDAELKALGVERQVDETGNAIYVLPPGKELKFPTNAPIAKGQVDALRIAIDNVRPTKWVDFYINTIVTGDPIPAGAGSPGMLGSATGNAQGGFVRKGIATWVGENGRELFIPAADGEIIPHAKSEYVANQGLSKSPPPVQGAVGGDGAAAVDILAYIATLIENQQLTVSGDSLSLLVNRTNLRNEVR